MFAHNNKCFTIVGILHALISFGRAVHSERRSQTDATLVLKLNSTKPRRVARKGEFHSVICGV